MRPRACYFDSAVKPSISLLRTTSRFILTCFITVTLVGVCAAPVSPPDPPVPERGQLASAYLTKKLAFWRKRLDLQEWQVTLELADRKALRGGSLGNIHWDLQTKTARIRVLDASEYKTSYEAALRDMEFTVVHELMHLNLAAMPRNDESRKDEERAVDHMANALLALERHE